MATTIRDRIVGFKRVKAARLVVNPNNWRVHNEGQKSVLRDILKEVGIANALVCRQLPNNKLEVIDGHLRQDADPSITWPVLILDVDENEAKKLLLSFDPLAAMATTDIAKLEVLRSEVATESANMALMWEQQAEGARQLAEVAAAASASAVSEDTGGLADDDAIPVLAKRKAITRLGDVWSLGRHRLLCGDALEPAAVEKVSKGDRIAALITDPPYGVGFDYSQHVDTTDKDMHATFCRAFLQASLPRTERAIITPGANNLRAFLNEVGDNISHVGVWTKTNALTHGHVTHYWCWEPVLFIGKFTKRRANDVFNYPVGMQHDTGDHTCPKPAGLFRDLLQNFTEKGDIVLDVFGGSGTTLIAAERTGRACRVIEIDPAYCDLIVKRWSDFTGEKARCDRK